MKRCLVWLFLCIFLCPSGMAERKKVGLVLSGGGAKGIAHIGVIGAGKGGDTCGLCRRDQHGIDCGRIVCDRV